MTQFNILNHFGTIIDKIEAETADAAMRIYKTKCDLTQAQVERAGYKVEGQESVKPVPRNGEVWETKSGNSALIVERPTPNGPEVGFVWLDSFDKNLCYATLMDQLSHRVNTSITEWGMMMQAWLKPPAPL